MAQHDEGAQGDGAADSTPVGERPPEPPPSKPTLSRRSVFVGMAGVAGVAAVDVGAFAYAGGWLLPSRLTPSRFTDRFEHPRGGTQGREHPDGALGRGRRSD